MKRFVWRLQRVLEVKSKQEQLKRNELVRLAEQLAAKRGELLLRQRILQDLIAGIQEDGSPARWRTQAFFLRHATADDEWIRRLQTEIATLEIQHQEKTAEVLALRRFKEGLERLRERAREEYLRTQERLEQKDLDERATIAFVRRERVFPDSRDQESDT